MVTDLDSLLEMFRDEEVNHILAKTFAQPPAPSTPTVVPSAEPASMVLEQSTPHSMQPNIEPAELEGLSEQPPEEPLPSVINHCKINGLDPGLILGSGSKQRRKPSEKAAMGSGMDNIDEVAEVPHLKRTKTHS